MSAPPFTISLKNFISLSFSSTSIATAISEYIHDNIRAKTIFATHYHELTQLGDKLDRAENYRIEVEENDKEIKFLREIVKGGADKSYGIEVARLAGLPKEILVNSKKILKVLEQRKNIVEKKLGGEQMMLFAPSVQEETVKKEEIVQEEKTISKEEKLTLKLLRSLDINTLTPMDAMIKLNELKKLLN